MTERLYYNDSYTREFRARVVDAADDGRRVYLDRTAFYPASGGQPFDIGSLDASQVVEVVDEGERIAHLLDRPLPAGEVHGSIDWARRYDHMQQHSGQHLLSAVFIDVFGMETVELSSRPGGFHDRSGNAGRRAGAGAGRGTAGQ